MKILLVDDDKDLLDLTAQRLKRRGCDVLMASNLAEAMSAFNEDPASFVGIVCDLFIGPGENGIDLFESIRKRGFVGEFVLTTGDDLGDARISLYKQSEKKFSCLQKPYPVNDLLSILKGAANGNA